MKKILLSFSLILCFLCVAACSQQSNADVNNNNENKQTTAPVATVETEVPDENYNAYLELIETQKYEDAYKKIDEIKDKALAEELRSKFIVIEDVLLSKTIIIPDDNLGNKIGPYTVNFSYDTNGNMVEVIALDIPVAKLQIRAINHLMENANLLNYYPYYEKLTYDENNKLIKITGYKKDCETINHIADFFYDENGNNVKIVYTIEGASDSSFLEYDGDNRLVKVQTGSRTRYIQYDNNGNAIEEGTIYDDQGRVTESKTYYWGNSMIEGKCVWNYGDYYIYNR